MIPASNTMFLWNIAQLKMAADHATLTLISRKLKAAQTAPFRSRVVLRTLSWMLSSGSDLGSWVLPETTLAYES
jgi:hypothetical protein